MKKLAAFLFIHLGSFGLASAQSYSEPPDLPNSIGMIGPASTFTLAAGVNTYSGMIETPSDGQDNFDWIVPAGLQIVQIDWQITDPNSLLNGFLQFNSSSVTNWPTGGGSGTHAESYPISSGTYTVNVVANVAYQSVWTLTVTVASTGGCNDPDVPVVTASTDTACAGDSVQLNFTGSLNDATGWELYDGSCGGSSIASTITNSFTVMAGSSTTYHIRGEGGCVTPGNCGSASITVSPALVLSATPTDEMLGSDGAIDLTVSGGLPGYTFDWDNDGMGDNDDVEDLSSLAAGTYVVWVTDTAGCQDSLSVVVGSQVGIQELPNIFKIYPNPSSGLIHFDLPTSEPFQIVVIGMDGRQVLNQTGHTGWNHIDLPTGMYGMKILIGDREFIGRLVIE